MKNSWMDTSGVFAAQVLGWMLFYGMTHNEIVALILVSVFSFFAVLFVNDERMRGIVLTATFAAFAVLAGLGAVSIVNTIPDMGAWHMIAVASLVAVTLFFLGLVFLVIGLEVDDEIEEDVPDSWWVLFPVRIPASIGTILGGVILLYRWLRRETDYHTGF